jgi:hypothetical protein
MSIFQKDLLVPPNPEELEITIFGPRYGESVVLHIPEIGWGIIDSCVAKISGNRIVPALEYLMDILTNPYPKLAFVVLTHPHEDHYKGLDDILKNYPGGVDRICRYHGNGARELNYYLLERRQALKNDLPELLNILNAMTSTVKEKNARPRKLGEMSVVFDKKDVDIPGFGKTDIQLIAMSPSSESDDKYAKTLLNSRTSTGDVMRFVDPNIHNIISVVLFLAVGKIKAIFAADLQEDEGVGSGWNAILNNSDLPDLAVDFVKVSHHGSITGHNEKIWQQHSKARKPLAVVTPFRRGSNKLPTEEDIARIQNIADKVGITDEIILSQNLYKYYKKETATTLQRNLRKINIAEPLEHIGFVRVRYNLDGNIVELKAQPPGRWI